MTAQKLRDAAARIREVAQASGSLDWDWYSADGFRRMLLTQPGASTLGDESQDEMRAEAAHLSLWSPPVAAAVADWLDRVGGWEDEGLGTCFQLDRTNYQDAWQEVREGALNLADLILAGAR